MSVMTLSGGVGRWISAVLAWLMVLQGFEMVVKAQATALKIVILDGEGAINDIKQRIAREPIVEIRDENDRPLSGALVVFTLPDRGASGVFADGSRSLMVHTDTKGQAVARGLRPNQTTWKFQIRVDTSYQGLTANTSISQTNVGAAVAGAGISAKWVTILSIVGGAAAVGAVAATRGSSQSSSSTTISPGRTTVGPP